LTSDAAIHRTGDRSLNKSIAYAPNFVKKCLVDAL